MITIENSNQIIKNINSCDLEGTWIALNVSFALNISFQGLENTRATFRPKNYASPGLTNFSLHCALNEFYLAPNSKLCSKGQSFATFKKIQYDFMQCLKPRTWFVKRKESLENFLDSTVRSSVHNHLQAVEQGHNFCRVGSL